MREKYSPWEFSGYSWASMTGAIQHIKDGNTEKAIERLEKAIAEYHILNKVNGLDK